MKLHIAICDDEKVETEYLSKLVHEWAATMNANTINANIIVSIYDSAEAFMFAYEEDKSFDVILLDIKMKKVDGLTLARKLRVSGGKMQIIFITGLSEFIAEGYEVSALHYLMKPVSKDKLFDVLNKALNLIEETEKSIIIETTQGRVRLFHHDIQYIDAFAHMAVIQTQSGAIEAKCSIGDFEAALGSEFCRAHRSCLVGLRHIRQITRTNIIMDSGTTIPLARRRYDSVNQAFIKYYKGVS